MIGCSAGGLVWSLGGFGLLETKPNHLMTIRSKIPLEVRFLNIFCLNNFAQKPWCDTFENWVGITLSLWPTQSDKVSHLAVRAKLGDTENVLEPNLKCNL